MNNWIYAYGNIGGADQTTIRRIQFEDCQNTFNMAFFRCNNCGGRSPMVEVESKLIDPYALDMEVNNKALRMRRYEEELKELDDYSKEGE